MEPGILLKDPGVLLKEPGVLSKDPGVFWCPFEGEVVLGPHPGDRGRASREGPPDQPGSASWEGPPRSAGSLVAGIRIPAGRGGPPGMQKTEALKKEKSWELK